MPADPPAPFSIDALTALPALIAALRAASSFQEAATLVLRRMLEVCDAALTPAERAGKGRILRGMVHLRPSGGYRGLVVIEHGAERPAAASGLDESLVPSTTAWRWIEAQRAPVAIDVSLGVATVMDARGDRSPEVRAGKGDARLEGQESRVRLLGRDATHLYALPFGARAGGLDGMISIEATCRGAMGAAFIWPRCGAELSLLADLAAPYFAALPVQVEPSAEVDPLLPVVGRATAGIVRLLRVFARQDETILLSGPTGSGKSRLARFCHERSLRQRGPFVVVDLLAVPEETQMGELFGWKKGAFTGAQADHRGSVARAETGTLFLDEIDKLSMKAQAGLLQLLEDRRYRALGDESERVADLRFLVGTNVDLEAAVRAGRFREDLYYRVNVLPVRLPALGERVDEIPRWAEHMADRRGREGGVTSTRLAVDAGLSLAARAWPGNLRQLDNVIRRAFVIALAERGEDRGALLIEARHVDEALAFDRSGAGEEGLFPLLQRAATAFAAAVETGGGRVDLDLADAFRGLVLAGMVRRTGSRDEAFRRLGKAGLLKNRNHHKALKREIARVIALAGALGHVVDDELARLGQDGDEGR